jgi:hypothetical protein
LKVRKRKGSVPPFVVGIRNEWIESFHFDQSTHGQLALMYQKRMNWKEYSQSKSIIDICPCIRNEWFERWPR